MRARVLEAASGALAAIEAARARIDDLNVYPVPDGDTGTNLALTVRAVVEAIEVSHADDRASLAKEISRAALMGARGNSGVILSQIVRGAADSLAGRDGLAPALRSASDAAYRAVRKPVEGTMLTAIRELAEAAEAGGDLAAVIARGDDCVVRTREMLPVLAEAGVVDAGAAGLVEILRGIARRARRRAAAASLRVAGQAAADSRVAPRGALAVPLLHGVRRRGGGARRRRARPRARPARRLAARRRRPDRAQGPRPHRRSRPGALAGRRPRSPRERRDRRHARADARPPRRGCSMRCPTAPPLPLCGRRGRVGGGQPRPLRESRRRRSSTAAGR